MAERGMCSRREADAYIERGWVRVDGVVVSELGSTAWPGQKITLEKRLSAGKPRGSRFCSTSRLLCVGPGRRRLPYGGFADFGQTRYRSDHSPLRLTRRICEAWRRQGGWTSTPGLLVLTQDGRIARQLVGEDSDIEKEYLVRVQGRISSNGLAQLNHVLSLDGKPLRPAHVEWQNEDQLRFLLHEGKNVRFAECASLWA